MVYKVQLFFNIPEAQDFSAEHVRQQRCRWKTNRIKKGCISSSSNRKENDFGRWQTVTRQKGPLGKYLNCGFTNPHSPSNICWQWFLSYPFACSSSNRWVAFGSLPYSAQHDFNQSCFLSVCESYTQYGKKRGKTLSLCLFASWEKCRDVKKSDTPSSPGSGSSSSRLIIHSQSFSSSAPHSQRESTR